MLETYRTIQKNTSTQKWRYVRNGSILLHQIFFVYLATVTRVPNYITFQSAVIQFFCEDSETDREIQRQMQPKTILALRGMAGTCVGIWEQCPFHCWL